MILLIKSSLIKEHFNLRKFCLIIALQIFEIILSVLL